MSAPGGGGTATVTCAGECAVTPGQTVTILDANDVSEYPGITVGSVLAPNQFTFSSSLNGTVNGGFITSNNVEDIFQSYSPENLDGSTVGKTQSFSDFVVTGVTSIGRLRR